MYSSVYEQMERLKEWRQRNPLRMWRKGRGADVSLQSAAVMLGMSTVTVRNWELGVTTPRPEAFEAMNALTGMDMQEKWSQWEAERPQFANKNREV